MFTFILRIKKKKTTNQINHFLKDEKRSRRSHNHQGLTTQEAT